MKLAARPGFTIFELIVVISVATVLVLVMVPSYIAMKAHLALGNETAEVMNALRIAQTKSMSSQDGSRHGIHFYESYVDLFKWNGSAETLVARYTLDSGVEIDAADIGTVVLFTRLTGEAGAASDVNIVLPGTGEQKTIQIEPSGKMSIL